MGRHARYTKYHFANSIEIQRVRCRGCGTTHALIPLFSVPGTSLGREEAERCLKARWEGASRTSAGAELVGQGMEPRSGRSLERKLAIAVEREGDLAAGCRYALQPAGMDHGRLWLHGAAHRGDEPLCPGARSECDLLLPRNDPALSAENPRRRPFT
jgi:hypothetical protein